MAAEGQDTQREPQRSEEEQRRRDEVVRHLKAKVLKYRSKCQALEERLEAHGGSLPGGRKATEDHSLEKVLLELEKEKLRRESLAEMNSRLREQLNRTNEVNSALKEDVGRLMADRMKARKELELKESERCSEREVSPGYGNGEHNRLLSLWHEVETFRHHFLEMKTATDRDLSELKAEQMRLSGAILLNCSQLNANVQLQASLTPCRPVLKDQAQQQTGERINQKTQKVMYLHELEKKELQDRVAELSALLEQSQRENKEKEKRLKTLKNTVELQALREEIYAKDTTINILQHKLRQQEEECRRLQQRLEQLEKECKPASPQQRLQALRDALRM
ncbi:centrosome-associated protein CEP250-like [Strigops habroptila]|uniref:centrosome-associated protein CEP250-like n=1 Tax=Strigops habroptila TaxID=2489341 RepID=UPI0011CF49D5|nr:centrosome-associated protein CEP250-like [Strigops habroptila]